MPARVALSPAIEFVRGAGSPEALASLKVLLHEPLDDQDLVALTEQQNPDGGFRVSGLQTEVSVVGRTAEKLLYLASLGAEEFGVAQAAADFLIECQRPDGSWGELAALRAASPPPHFDPSSAEVVGWETAAGVVALRGMGLPLDFRSALDFLARHRLAPDTKRTFRLELVLLFAAFHGTEGLAHIASATKVRAELEAIPAGELEVFEFNWGLLALSAAGLDKGDGLVRAWGEAFAAKQRPDGSFGSGPQGSAYETVLALCSLGRAGIVALPRAKRPVDDEPDPAKSDHGI
jgi:hypothetical protein